MRSIVYLLLLHLLVFLSTRQMTVYASEFTQVDAQGRVIAASRPLPTLADLWSGLAAYPGHLWGILRGEGLEFYVFGLRYTVLYLVLSIVLAWVLVPLFLRLPGGVLATLSVTPPFILLTLAVFLIITLAHTFGFYVSVAAGALWLVGIVALSLALPLTARLASYLVLRLQEVKQARFVQTARSLGLSERRVRAWTLRPVLPEGVGLMAGEVFGLTFSLVLVEGLLLLPGVGGRVYGLIMDLLLPGRRGIPATPEEASAGIFLLLVLAVPWSLAATYMAARLDPRSRL